MVFASSVKMATLRYPFASIHARYMPGVLNGMTRILKYVCLLTTTNPAIPSADGSHTSRNKV